MGVVGPTTPSLDSVIYFPSIVVAADVRLTPKSGPRAGASGESVIDAVDGSTAGIAMCHGGYWNRQ